MPGALCHCNISMEIVTAKEVHELIKVVALSEVCTTCIFKQLNIWIMGSNPTWGSDVYPLLFRVCVLMCR
jgi:hypothetical protein